MSIPTLDDFNERARKKKATESRTRTQKPSVKAPEGINAFWNNLGNFNADAVQNIGNFAGTIGSFLGGRQQAPGQGPGDAMAKTLRAGLYTTPKPPAGTRARAGGGSWNAPAGAEEERQKTLSDYLSMASEIMGGAGSIPGVNYDAERNTLRQNASENDARLEAMYRQLRGSIDADAPVLQKGYQDAINSTAANAANAQTQTQAATDAANARNNEVLANLGIQQAQGNIIQQGTDLNTQTAQRIADQATKGQAATDRLVSNQATALQHNTNIGNAAGLEGNLQRATNQAKLQSLLAAIDSREADANASIAAQNAALGRSSRDGALSLAQTLYGNDVDERRYQDSLAQSAAELAAKGQQALPDLGTMLQALGMTTEDVRKNPRDIASLLSALKSFSVVQ